MALAQKGYTNQFVLSCGLRSRPTSVAEMLLFVKSWQARDSRFMNSPCYLLLGKLGVPLGTDRDLSWDTAPTSLQWAQKKAQVLGSSSRHCISKVLVNLCCLGTQVTKEQVNIPF